MCFYGLIWRNDQGAYCVGDRKGDNWAFSPGQVNTRHIGLYAEVEIRQLSRPAHGYAVTLVKTFNYFHLRGQIRLAIEKETSSA